MGGLVGRRILRTRRRAEWVMEPLQRRVAVHLRAARLARKWTITRMSAKTGISRRTLRRLEEGRSLSWTTVELVCEALGIHLLLSTQPRYGPKRDDPGR